ncbi:MAG: spore coat associated protein CotJA [Bacillota bacterium]
MNFKLPGLKEIKEKARNITGVMEPGYHKKVRLTTAYVPPQCYGTQFPPDEALKKGTLWPDLYSPYHCPECPPFPN